MSKHDVLTLDLMAQNQTYKFEFTDSRGETQCILFEAPRTEDGAKELLEDLANSLDAYIGR